MKVGLCPFGGNLTPSLALGQHSVGTEKGYIPAFALSWSVSLFLSFFFFFGCGPFLKSLLNLLQYCFCYVLCFGFFGCEACGILAPQPGIEPASPALEGEVLTTGPARKSLMASIFNHVPLLPFSYAPDEPLPDLWPHHPLWPCSCPLSLTHPAAALALVPVFCY